MPPRKRARVSEAASPVGDTKTPEPSREPTDDDVLNDPWTDEEETGLFKGLIKWKPTGIHKHFRMLQLREYLLQNNYIHPRSKHTQVAGIWQKLESLYDLEALDQREDARQLSDLSEEDVTDDEEEDVYSLAANKIHNATFELPDEDYAEKMWTQRLADGHEESPPVLPELNLQQPPSVRLATSFSAEAEEATPTARPKGRPSRGSTRGKAVPPPRKSRRQTGSVATASDAASEEPDVSAEDGSGSEEEEGSAEEEVTGEPDAAIARRGGRGRGRGSRGRPRGRRRG